MESTIIEKGLGYEFLWQDGSGSGGSIEVQNIKQGSDRLTALIVFKSYLPGYKPLLLQRRANLLSTKAARDLIKEATDACPYLPWREMYEQMLRCLLERLRRLPTEIVTPLDMVAEQTYLVDPIVPEGLSTIMYGAAGSGKSYLAQFLAIAVQLGPTDPVAQLRYKHANAIYVDYEASLEEFRRRTKRLCAGMGWPYVELIYLRGVAPLAECLMQLKTVVDEHKAKFLVIDSLGPAAGGNLNDAETAITFFEALRKLKCTAFIVAHVPKGPEKERSVFGSSYFTNLARMLWEVKGINEPTAIKIGLYNRKNNIGRLHRPLAFEITFGEQSARIEAVDIHKVPDLEEHLSPSERILNILRHGSRTIHELSEDLDLPETHIKYTLSRLKAKGKVRNVERGRWGLAPG